MGKQNLKIKEEKIVVFLQLFLAGLPTKTEGTM
jgi:hypothetical protein